MARLLYLRTALFSLTVTISLLCCVVLPYVRLLLLGAMTVSTVPSFPAAFSKLATLVQRMPVGPQGKAGSLNATLNVRQQVRQAQAQAQAVALGFA